MNMTGEWPNIKCIFRNYRTSLEWWIALNNLILDFIF